MGESQGSIRPTSHLGTSGHELGTSGKGTLRLRHAFPAALTLLGGIALTFLAARFTGERERQAGRLEFVAAAEGASLALFSEFGVPLEVSLALPAFVASHPSLDAGTFEAYVKPALERHRGIAALEWAAAVRDEDRATFEARLGRAILEGGSGTKLTRAERRAEYFPLVYVVPMYPPVVGLDIAYEPGRRAMVDAAIASGSPKVSPRFRLAEDVEGVNSVAIYSPVFAPPNPAPHDRARTVRGFGITLFRLEPFVAHALEGRDLTGLGFELRDDSASPDEAVLASRPLLGAFEEEPLSFRQTKEFLGRRWTLVWKGDPERFVTGSTTRTTLLLGVLISLFVSCIVLAVSLFGRLRRQIDAALRLGNYTLRRKLGEGGMGSVYLADHALLRRPTAIKLIKKDAVTRAAEERFAREVQYTAKLTHPNTIQIYDYGRTPDGVFYYAMEYLEGVTLESLVAATGPLPPARAVHIMEQVSGSLAEAHHAGVVHRDLKPDNIMLCRRGGVPDFVKVLDFGLVKHFESDVDRGLSHATALVGTPAYMAPEAMVDPQSITPRADVYALGGVLYFLLTGTLVYPGRTLLALMSQALTEPPMPPEERLGRPLPSGLSALVLRCLSRHPEERPADAGELLAALRALDVGAPWKESDAEEFWRTFRPNEAAPSAESFETDRTIEIDLGDRHDGQRHGGDRHGGTRKAS